MRTFVKDLSLHVKLSSCPYVVQVLMAFVDWSADAAYLVLPRLPYDLLRLPELRDELGYGDVRPFFVVAHQDAFI